MRPDIFQALKQRTLLFDGGLGTQLQARGLPVGTSPELWNQLHPEQIAAVHQDYLQAGADILTTNSFGASPHKLQMDQVPGDPAEINRIAAGIARKVAGEHAWVAGSIGPTGIMLALDDHPVEAIQAGFERQARGLAEGGADFILIETMSDLAEALLAIRGARAGCSLPVLASFTFSPGQRGYRTLMGNAIPEVAAAMTEARVAVMGCNCGTGIEDAIAIVREIHSVWQGPVLAEPNAGLPQLVNGETRYSETPEKMAAKLPALIEAGASGMRMDLTEQGIKVTNIAPGAVETEFSLVRFKGDSARAEKVYAGFEPLKADDIADAIFYAVSAPAHVTIADMTILAAAQSQATVIHRQ